jgi:tRNA-dihydrouridine synthase C
MPKLLNSYIPALILAPMDGITDAPMRAVQGEIGAFSFAVSEFIRVSQEAPPRHVFLRHVPELAEGGLTPTGLPVQVQLLGGDPDRMARAAVTACEAGARAIDINFGCPAPTVNRHDGGATLLKFPHRIREVVAAMRAAVPKEIPVSAKLRLGWDSIDSIYENAAMAAEGGASWLTIHGRTRVAGYQPPAFWRPIGLVRERLGLPVVANGDIWTIEDFRRCREETDCIHFMLGRGAMANPLLPAQAARELGIAHVVQHRIAGDPVHSAAGTLHGPGIAPGAPLGDAERDWAPRLRRLAHWMDYFEGPGAASKRVHRLKQWLKLAARFGEFTEFESIKRAQSVDELLRCLASPHLLAA